MIEKPLTPLHMNTSKYGNSSFWLDKFDTDIDLYGDTELRKKNNDIYKLAARKRAVSNFVSILTSKQIPVQFATLGDSYTDGTSVVISSKLTEASDFDIAVGLALHEASHIKLSSFTFLQNLNTEIYNLSDYYDLNDVCTKLGIDILPTLKDILNWVEDRRIDDFVFKSSPGYRDYYIALYDKYFNDKLIDMALKSDEHTEETFESYMFRLINLQSKSARFDALRGLKEIVKISDLNNISRLKTTKEAFEVAVEIFRVILKNSTPPLLKKDGGSSPDENSNDKNELSDEEFNDLMKSLSEEQTDEGGENSNSDNGNGKSDTVGDSESHNNGGASMEVTNLPDGLGEPSTSDSTPASKSVKLTDKQKNLLKKKIEKQKSFINGDIKKTKITKSDAKSIKAIESSEAELVEVGQTYEFNSNWHTVGSITCIFVKNISRELLEDNTFPLTRSVVDYKNGKYITTLSDSSKPYVEAGIRLGTILGKRLQTHSESRDTIFNRQPIGKLDRRMVASLGFGNEQVFFTKETDKYNKANLHISIDASGSMCGLKWANTMTNAVALAKAVDMIPTLEIQITFRSTNENGTPYVVVGYDSRKDKFSKIKLLFPYLTPYGTTPEGLCFEAISKYMVGSSDNLDSYFLNVSDGEPYFQHNGFYYTGFPAAKHTKKMVDNMKRMGIRVMSYFVGDTYSHSNESSLSKVFKESYGDAARFIDVTSVGEVSKTMNRLFLQK
jgi:hypothetical protein